MKNKLSSSTSKLLTLAAYLAVIQMHASSVVLRAEVLPKQVEESNDRSWSNRLEYVGIAVEEPGYHIWGTSPLIGPNGKTHLFVSRWQVSKGFDAWNTDCEIARYVGNTPEGPFKFCEVVLKGNDSNTWDRVSPHNPTIHQVGNSYALLYIANSGGNKKQRIKSQRIGMVVAENLNGPWRNAGDGGPILSPPDDPSVWSYGSSVGVNNPALLLHPDGRFFLYYKAKKNGDVRRMGIAISDKLEGPYVHMKDPLTSNHTEIEDGYAFTEQGNFSLVTTNNAEASGYLWESEDGIHFKDPIIGFERLNAYLSKKTIQNAVKHRGKKFERPQLLIQQGKVSYLYVALGANIQGGDGTCSCVLRVHQLNE